MGGGKLEVYDVAAGNLDQATRSLKEGLLQPLAIQDTSASMSTRTRMEGPPH